MTDIKDSEGKVSEGNGSPASDPASKEYLRELLQQRLVECGWYGKLRRLVRCVVSKRGGMNLSHHDIHAVILPKARNLVPDEIYMELQAIVRDGLEASRC